MAKEKFFVYVLQSMKDFSFYTGFGGIVQTKNCEEAGPKD